ncbi:MAG: patatin-like phospholipase family protein [Bacteroidetes bacterium]|nr:patatin-like phospholipase family protein [Bacteroidota bacterium]
MKLKKHISLILFLISSFIFSSCSSTFMVIDSPRTMPPPRKLDKKPRVALVLGGGAFLGMAHLGALKVFEENKIPVDLIVGTSVGSFVGAMYANNPNSDSLRNLASKIKSEEIFNASLFNSMVGFVTGENLQAYIKEHIKTKNIEDLKIPFVAITSDLISGKTIPLSSGPIAPSVNSSCAIPMVFEPVKMYGMVLVDGGVWNNVAVDIAKSYEPDVVIAINLMSVLPSVKADDIKTFLDVYRRSGQVNAINIGNHNASLADVVLNPKVDQFPPLSDQYDKQIYDAGYNAAKEKIDEIKKIIEEKIKDK